MIMENIIDKIDVKQRAKIKYYRWEIVIFDQEKKQFTQGKYRTMKELNEDLGLKISGDLAWRLTNGVKTGKRYDADGKAGSWSMKEKYGHIKLTKINELIT